MKVVAEIKTAKMRVVFHVIYTSNKTKCIQDNMESERISTKAAIYISVKNCYIPLVEREVHQDLKTIDNVHLPPQFLSKLELAQL